MAHAEPIAERLPPFNREAERGDLGGIFRDPSVLHDVQAMLRPESFYFHAHCAIFRAMCGLAAEGKPIDLVTVHERLVVAKEAENVGGAPYLADLWDAVPTSANAEYHAKIVRDTAAVRGLIHAANETLRDAYDRTGSVDELIASAERKLFDLSATGNESDLLDAAALAADALGAIDDRASRDGPDGLPVGFRELDDALAGLKGGQLIVIGARPGCGKTALGLAVAESNAATGNAVLFASLEMGNRELMNRVFAMRSGVPLRTIASGKLNGDQAEAVTKSGQEFAKQPFFLVTVPDLSAARLAAIVRRGIRRRGVKLVVVDYLQLLKPENERDPRHLQVGTLARRLKQLARTCDVPVILLAQLNREVENRADGKPRLADLRESGEIEAHADAVLLLHARPNQDANAAVWTTDVIIAKNRNGPVAEVALSYRRPLTRFEDYAPLHGSAT
ncbi:replicative dna helicase : Replicative DNA helicase OS=Singulisphaera acidiphila (strain ATCC BAA-1392 / DSM 18658 / VKM B-2454 / MOB10) GN=Sinac_0836 PE=4 SV=1: DnaB: DnaB_C [Gemmataceae bacterium]|jgi:replicative DNA helicase|nr:replicative dna helicase : Replicative DNA helicase OS=Singulisphaera acidiphila (strain ATCC BAA-1392 / DSM 18658 / VKM B-2454 / MOB10) GN=Sinac_0836 PE=4 SV=1: DnaB: DnaB_C [Gemmataceae bacterium]VTT97955.1 replicative dna helicase : Replicative DNA helicase OS=Singulisphaera acidiphila (strain ATCC BAA-1392 / DSM 18658 / VKM B-2454 / MOB10) GN=Sinac_0836 PE=4 SV=1: DnaB: DnaB_C [Gemmataceae bacterium]